MTRVNEVIRTRIAGASARIVSSKSSCSERTTSAGFVAEGVTPKLILGTGTVGGMACASAGRQKRVSATTPAQASAPTVQHSVRRVTRAGDVTGGRPAS